jgi:hypothetical protein
MAIPESTIPENKYIFKMSRVLYDWLSRKTIWENAIPENNFRNNSEIAPARPLQNRVHSGIAILD